MTEYTLYISTIRWQALNFFVIGGVNYIFEPFKPILSLFFELRTPVIHIQSQAIRQHIYSREIDSRERREKNNNNDDDDDCVLVDDDDVDDDDVDDDDVNDDDDENDGTRSVKPWASNSAIDQSIENDVELWQSRNEDCV